MNTEMSIPTPVHEVPFRGELTTIWKQEKDDLFSRIEALEKHMSHAYDLIHDMQNKLDEAQDKVQAIEEHLSRASGARTSVSKGVSSRPHPPEGTTGFR